MCSFAEQDGTFVNYQGRLQRIKRALRPINNRKTEIQAATFTAEALGMGKQWTLRNWTTAYKQLQKHTNLLKDIRVLKLGADGVELSGDEEPIYAPSFNQQAVPA